MQKWKVAVIAGCAGASLIMCGYQNGNEAMAALDLSETNSAVAGFSIALNNFCEGIENPEAEIKSYLQSDIVFAVNPNAVILEEKSPYADIAVSKIEAEGKYVNIRNAASTEGEILGKIYNNSAATILETVEGEGGTWYRIHSGNVEGYIKAEYFVTGDEAEALAIKIGRIFGRVKEGGLRLRAEANTESEIITKLWEGEIYTVVEQADEFVKISLGTDDDGTSVQGYVSKEYVDVYVDFDEAISLEEERQMLEEQQRKEAEARLMQEKLNEANKAVSAKTNKNEASGNSASSNHQTAAPQETQAAAPQETQPAVQTPNNTSTATRDAIVAYARQFEGNPYVYGGESLTHGADCSGFTRAVFRQFGISLVHSSGRQAGQGRAISESELRPGDLIFYGNGGKIGHVALYIGGGCVIHASDEQTGIKISQYNYRTPLKFVNVIGD